MMNLKESQESALKEYKEAKQAWAETVTKDNIRGDFEKWKSFCIAKSHCRQCGVRI